MAENVFDNDIFSSSALHPAVVLAFVMNICQHHSRLNYLQRASTNEWQCKGALCANLPLQAVCVQGRACGVGSRSTGFRCLDTEMNGHLFCSPAACRLHLPAGPVTPAPAEVQIRNDILTSVPESLIESVCCFNMMTSLSMAKLERFIN